MSEWRFDRQLSVGKQMFGTKREQVGLRLSELELENAERLQAHLGTDFASLVEFAMLSFLQQLEEGKTDLDALRDEYLQFTPPKSACFKHARISPVIKSRMETALRLLRGDIKLATGTRWALLRIAPGVLAQPSREERVRAEQEAQRQRDAARALIAAQKRENAVVIKVPHGSGFIDPTKG